MEFKYVNTNSYAPPMPALLYHLPPRSGTLYPINRTGEGISEPNFSLAAFQKVV
jgi:hypothetical protein